MELVAFEEVLAETSLAFLFVINGEEVWVPKSVMDDPDAVEKGDQDGEVYVAEWYVRRRNIDGSY